MDRIYGGYPLIAGPGGPIYTTAGSTAFDRQIQLTRLITAQK
jgi:hypothetical protein